MRYVILIFTNLTGKFYTHKYKFFDKESPLLDCVYQTMILVQMMNVWIMYNFIKNSYHYFYLTLKGELQINAFPTSFPSSLLSTFFLSSFFLCSFLSLYFFFLNFFLSFLWMHVWFGFEVLSYTSLLFVGTSGFVDCFVPVHFREHREFVLLCLKVLCVHLSLAQVTLGSKNLGKQAKPLRNLLFKLIDMKTPESIQQVIKQMVHKSMQCKSSLVVACLNNI